MKNTPCAILLALFFFTVQGLHAQVSSADTMVQRLFATLKAKDEKGFVALYPSREQFGRFMRNLLEQTPKSDEMKKLMAQDEKSKNMNVDSLINTQVTAIASAEAFAKMQQSFGEQFRKIIEKGEKKGVPWNEARLTTYTIDSTANLAEGAPFQLTGMKAAKGVIDFAAGDGAYQLAFDKMIFLSGEGGWFGGEFQQLARKGDSLEPDKEENKAMDEAPAAKEKTTPPKAKLPAKKTTTKPAARKNA